ncbi:acetyltransferase [[Pseudomonas] carboxydohydrogena]|uniref:Acetyltransferase n=1 Tax=Afipia carboxydohydrogena TaxID=290 RepID=A0ABY8BNF3_AFICR|nr:acetyltransferase [[Pseudomonas] carboxydohydrogena]WEF51056.1 acetyltransferase [[Pseudomonas] carboxydohydrogena]
MKKTRKLVIVGDSAFAEIALEYFEVDSTYSPVAFAVESEYLKRDSLNGVPVVPFETLSSTHPPSEYDVYVAIVYSQLNRLRTRLALSAKASGYRLASYVSSRSFVWRNVQLGEHVFIFEDNTVQPFSAIGDNVVLWSGNHIGHHSKVLNNAFISSHVVVSGFCTIGENCFLGVNSAIGNNVEVGEDCWIGPGVSITRNVPKDSIVRAPEHEIAKIGARRFFKVK